LCTGLLEIYGRIPVSRELDKDEAAEHVRAPLPAYATFPFKEGTELYSNHNPTAHKDSRPEPTASSSRHIDTQVITEDETGFQKTTTDQIRAGAAKSGTMKHITQGKKRKGNRSPVDSTEFRKYGGKLNFPYLEEEIKTFILEHDCLKKFPSLHKPPMHVNFELNVKKHLEQIQVSLETLVVLKTRSRS
jgi:hypothetical protein